MNGFSNIKREWITMTVGHVTLNFNKSANNGVQDLMIIFCYSLCNNHFKFLPKVTSTWENAILTNYEINIDISSKQIAKPIITILYLGQCSYLSF